MARTPLGDALCADDLSLFVDKAATVVIAKDDVPPRREAWRDLDILEVGPPAVVIEALNSVLVEVIAQRDDEFAADRRAGFAIASATLRLFDGRVTAGGPRTDEAMPVAIDDSAETPAVDCSASVGERPPTARPMYLLRGTLRAEI